MVQIEWNTVQYLFAEQFEIVGFEDPVVGQVDRRQGRRLLRQEPDQLQVEVSVEEDETAHFEFPKNNRKPNLPLTF